MHSLPAEPAHPGVPELAAAARELVAVARVTYEELGEQLELGGTGLMLGRWTSLGRAIARVESVLEAR